MTFSRGPHFCKFRESSTIREKISTHWKLLRWTHCGSQKSEPANNLDFSTSARVKFKIRENLSPGKLGRLQYLLLFATQSMHDPGEAPVVLWRSRLLAGLLCAILEPLQQLLPLVDAWLEAARSTAQGRWRQATQTVLALAASHVQVLHLSCAYRQRYRLLWPRISDWVSSNSLSLIATQNGSQALLSFISLRINAMLVLIKIFFIGAS